MAQKLCNIHHPFLNVEVPSMKAKGISLVSLSDQFSAGINLSIESSELKNQLHKTLDIWFCNWSAGLPCTACAYCVITYSDLRRWPFARHCWKIWCHIPLQGHNTLYIEGPLFHNSIYSFYFYFLHLAYSKQLWSTTRSCSLNKRAHLFLYG